VSCLKNDDLATTARLTRKSRQTHTIERPGFAPPLEVTAEHGTDTPQRPIMSAAPSDLPIGFLHPSVKLKSVSHHRVNGAWQTSRFFASEQDWIHRHDKYGRRMRSPNPTSAPARFRLLIPPSQPRSGGML